MTSASNLDKNSWILDSDCTAHISNNLSAFHNVKSTNVFVIIANDTRVRIETCENIRAVCGTSKLELRDVLYCMKVRANLMLFKQLLDKDWWVSVFTKEKIVLVKGDFEIVGKMNVKSNLWIVKIDYIIPEVENRAFLSLHEWHCNFSHQNMKYTRDLLKKYDIPFQDLKTSCVSVLRVKR